LKVIASIGQKEKFEAKKVWRALANSFYGKNINLNLD
jgi:hypothetical protein